ncbi:MAG: hypothetical protein OXB92_06245, partial [Acidimicrobiaceae bacterium]|nr:hypothetical protein [Acidimicrobiaceae bacterium]
MRALMVARSPLVAVAWVGAVLALLAGLLGVVPLTDAPPAGAQGSGAAARSPGALDSSFGFPAGLVFPRFTDDSEQQSGRAVAVADDGKIVVAGSQDTLDEDFASGGGSLEDRQILVARYHRSGLLDTSFGRGGLARLDLTPTARTGSDDLTADSIDAALAVDVQSDGKVVVAGESYRLFKNADDVILTQTVAFVARFTAAGALDTTFGTVVSGSTRTGWFEVAPSSVHSGAHAAFYAVEVLADGKILAAGILSPSALIVRLTSSGALDTTFSDDGMDANDVFSAFSGQEDYFFDLDVQSDGKIVAGGRGHRDISQGIGSVVAGLEAGLVRFTADGTRDTTFGELSDPADPSSARTGSVGVGELWGGGALGTRDNDISGLEVLADGRIVVVGAAGTTRKPLTSGKPFPPTDARVALARFNENGTLDTSFATNGGARFELDLVVDRKPARREVPTSLAVDSNGSLFVSVTAHAREDTQAVGIDPYVVKFTPDGALDTNFRTAGSAWDVAGSVWATVTRGNNQSGGASTELVLDSDGRVLVVGETNLPSKSAEIFLARILPDGRFDTE